MAVSYIKILKNVVEMKLYKKMTKFWKFFIILNLIGLGSAGVLANYGKKNYTSQEVYFNPSFVNDWTSIDTSLKLHGRLYLPRNHSAQSLFPAVIMFPGVNRTLEDNDGLAQKVVNMGAVAFSITYRGHGKSNGTFPITDGNRYDVIFSDALGAYRYVRALKYVDPNRIISSGNSLGGGAAVFLAMSSLTPKFVATFPALSYPLDGKPLYLHTGPGREFEGFIMAGTNDECFWCYPKFVNKIKEINPSIEIKWFEGASHTDGRFWTESVNLSSSWIAKTLKISENSLLNNWLYSGYFGYALLAIIVIIDLMIAFIKLVQIRRLRREASVKV
jgi:dienelactone hydrolase